MANRKGPQKLTLQRTNSGKVVFFIAFDSLHLALTLGEYPEMDLKDSEVRRLRDWLNWYLDNK